LLIRLTTVSLVVVFASLAGFYIGTTYPQDPDPSSTLPLSKTRPPSYKTGRAELEAAWADFVAIVGRDNVSTDPSDSSAHSTSDYASQRDNEGWRPFCVVYPASTDEVSRIMKVCHGRQIPVVAYSGGTSLEGHFAPTRGGICVDFGRMDKVLQLHADDLDVVVQPAVGWEDLNDVLGEQNLFFPPDPGPGARIGGMIGTGCSGTNAFRYGTMREWVVNLTVVLADGTIIKTRQRPRKSSAGYDLTKLFIGSEGTLGLVTEATLKVATKPASTTVAVASFGTVRQAADCVARVVREGIPVAAVEILDDDQMRYINRAGATTRRWAERPTLFFKFAGTQAGVREQVGLVQRLARTAGSQTFDFARGDEEQQELWSARKAGLWSTFAAREEGGFVWTTDVAVPMSRLPDIIEETKKDMAATGLNGSMLGHVGDGNFHSTLASFLSFPFSPYFFFVFCFPTRVRMLVLPILGEALPLMPCQGLILYTPSERKLAEALVHRMVKRAVEMEGTVTVSPSPKTLHWGGPSSLHFPNPQLTR
jgi:D-lactate dehydrogenase (cytochrome)